MSTDLRAAAAGYLTERRARGYRLPDHDWLIASFLDRLAARGITTITVADALAFARERPQTELAWQATRLRVIKDMAAYVHNLDPDAAGVIPAGLISATVTRRIPYLYTEEQTAQLMSAAQALSPRLLAASICTLIGLVASTGMRSGEAGALDVEDLCADKQVMTVTGKHGKQRLIPLHPTTVQALTGYMKVRAARAAPTGPLLVGPKGGRLNMTKARAIFRALVQDCRWPARPGCGAPRLHDFRHTFAVNHLIDAHRSGGDVDARLAALASYLGHVNPANTYWYLTASPQLMAVVSERIAAFYQKGRRR